MLTKNFPNSTDNLSMQQKIRTNWGRRWLQNGSSGVFLLYLATSLRKLQCVNQTSRVQRKFLLLKSEGIFGVFECDGGSGSCASHECGLWLWACAAIWDKFMQDSRVVYDQKYYVFFTFVFVFVFLIFFFFLNLILRDYHFTWRVIYGWENYLKFLREYVLFRFLLFLLLFVVLSVLLWKFSSLFDSRGNSLDLVIQLEINVNFFTLLFFFLFIMLIFGFV